MRKFPDYVISCDYDLKLHGKSESEIKELSSTAQKDETAKEIEEVGYKYLGILKYDKVKEKQMKFEFRNEYFRRTKLILKSQLNGRKKIMMLNNWAVFIMGFGGEIRRIRIRTEVSGIRINLRKCTERPESFLQRIKKSTQDVILQGCIFLEKKVEEDLLDTKKCGGRKKWPTLLRQKQHRTITSCNQNN